MESGNQIKQWIRVSTLFGLMLLGANLTGCQAALQAEVSGEQAEVTEVVRSIPPEFEVYQSPPSNRLETSQAKALGKNHGKVLAVRYSPQGDHIAVFTEPDKMVRIWNSQGKQVGQFKAGDLAGYESGYALQFSPQGDRLVTFIAPKPTEKSKKFEVKLWNLQGKQVGTFPQTWWNINYNPASKYYAATGEKPGEIRVWDFQGKEIITFQAPVDPRNLVIVNQLRISPSGNYILLTSNVAGSSLWDLKGKQLARFPDLKFQAIYFSGDEQRLIAIDDSKNLTQWSLQGQKVAETRVNTFLTRTSGYDVLLKRSTFAPKTEQFVAITSDALFIWNSQGKHIASFKGAYDWFQYPSGIERETVLKNKAGDRMVTLGMDDKVRLWSLEGDYLAKGEGYKVALSPDGKRIVVVSKADNIPRLWKVD